MKLHYQNFYILLIICVLLSACGQIPSTPTPRVETTSTTGTDITPIDLEAGYGVKGPWFELYFTDPTSPLSPQGTGGLDGPLVDAIDEARLSIAQLRGPQPAPHGGRRSSVTPARTVAN